MKTVLPALLVQQRERRKQKQGKGIMTITIKSRVILNILWIVIAGAFYWVSMPYSEARTFDPIGPHVFPQLMSTVIILCSLGNLFMLFRESGKQGADARAGEEFEPLNFVKVLLVLAAAALYIWIMPMAGYFLGTAFLLFLVIQIQGNIGIKINFLVSCGFALMLYLLFAKVLHILLPHGFLEFI